jgi:plastocyanin
MQKFNLLLIALFGFAVLVTTACGSGAAASGASTATAATSGADGTQRITVTVASGMSFDPATISVKAGQPVELMLTNTGDQPHDLSLSKGVDQPVKITAAGGQTASATFTLMQPGSYGFDCSMPGHSLAGMKGTIIAQ